MKRTLLIGFGLIIVFSVGLWRILGDFWNILVGGIGWFWAGLAVLVIALLIILNLLHRAVTYGQRNAYRRHPKGRRR